ncbi:conserved hypothetical protein [Ricinus communis]|uniref:Uncharacterized protein n=1 Tax=Ricinus communis TaxID=3988 RepID=B9SQI3_RICCO|nr:conserved hypothetical protein [Ricinus communis]
MAAKSLFLVFGLVQGNEEPSAFYKKDIPLWVLTRATDSNGAEFKLKIPTEKELRLLMFTTELNGSHQSKVAHDHCNFSTVCKMEEYKHRLVNLVLPTSAARLLIGEENTIFKIKTSSNS